MHAATSRRRFLGSLAAAPLAALGATARNAIAVTAVRTGYEDYPYRTPIKFGGVALDKVTLLNVWVEVKSSDGRPGQGFGSMPLGNVWSFPSRRLSYEETLGAMKALSEEIRRLMANAGISGHPVDITHALEPEYHKLAAKVTRQLQLAEPVPALCTLVTASPFDAALHDAYGKLHGVNCFRTYGPRHLRHDLSHYLGKEFRGEWLEKYVLRHAKPWMPLYHLVGALDPLTKADVVTPVGDGLPETLEEWIPRDGLTHLKIKLNGDDLAWDVQRVLSVDAVAVAAQSRRGVKTWYYSCDFNERCPNVEYLLAFLRQVKEKSPQGFARIQYVEQPTKRDLAADRANVMFEAAKWKPVVIDESLVDQESLLLAREMGYTGVALKACKGQTQSLLMAALAQKYKMFLCVQDLTCPGASLIHSASLAAHIPGVAAIEANARQYVPAANRGWSERFPGVFEIRNGRMRTGLLDGMGLGAVA